MDFLTRAKIVRLSGAVSAGATNIDCTPEVDCTGYESAVIIATFGTVVDTAVCGLKARLGDASGALTVAATPAASFIASTSSQKQLAIEVKRPNGKLISARIERTTANAALESCVLLLFDHRQGPSTMGDLLARAIG
ncbi:MAG TPA: hypothetical protein PLQ29_08695 [Spirochaetales bacterium]|nr:hypothetical protein [Bacillota bacterium]HPG86764.1 hypothetical protein [Spirochaetales bacterium]